MRLKWFDLRGDHVQAPPLSWLISLMGIHRLDLQEREQRLRAAGIAIHPAYYEVLRRMLVIASIFVCASMYFSYRYSGLFHATVMIYVCVLGLLVAALALGDRFLLDAIRKYRQQAMIREIYAVSNQLLYYAGTRMNLHHKLRRCLPYTRTIRRTWELLIHEWYHDPEAAITQFKERIGTDEAYSFAETIRSLRLDESESFYQLLRDRIRDYKEKIDLAKESKKETVSYLLFVLAGLPILNTFRVFIYPWIMESQRLFQLLN